MEAKIVYWCETLTSLAFWEGLLDSFQALGPFAPILMAMLESLVPALPLVAIVTLNVAAHGALLGFLYSWAGTCLGCTIVFLFFRAVCKGPLARLSEKNEKLRKARAWVNRFDPAALFFLVVLPFTPSAFVNIAFALSDFDSRRYLYTIYLAKLVMIALLAILGQTCVEALDNPWFIILSAALMAGLYFISKKVREKHGL